MIKPVTIDELRMAQLDLAQRVLAIHQAHSDQEERDFAMAELIGKSTALTFLVNAATTSAQRRWVEDGAEGDVERFSLESLIQVQVLFEVFKVLSFDLRIIGLGQMTEQMFDTFCGLVDQANLFCRTANNGGIIYGDNQSIDSIERSTPEEEGSAIDQQSSSD